MGRPRIHDDVTRERLFRAAESVVAYGGVDALSVRGLADAVGTTTRAVYSVFEGKEGIVRALYREAWIVLTQRLEELPLVEDPIEDVVRAGLDAFRWFATSRPNLFRLAFEGRLPFVPNGEDMAVALGARLEIQRRVERCAAAGLLGGRSVEAATLQFHALCQGLASNELNGWYLRFGDARQIWEEGLSALMLGMSSSPPADRQARPKRPRKPGLRKPRQPRKTAPKNRAASK
jgi:AcrR family transcriptional regulator